MTITLASDDTSEGTVAPASLTFDNLDWNVEQTVTVTGVDDAIGGQNDGPILYTIQTAIDTSGSTDTTGYASTQNPVDVPDVSVTNEDDDPPGISVSPVTGTTTENGLTTVAITIVLLSAPSADVVIPVSSSNTAEGTLDKAELTFTTTDWNVGQVVTVTGVNDDVDDGDIQYSLVTGVGQSSDVDYGGMEILDVTLTNTDGNSFSTVHCRCVYV